MTQSNEQPKEEWEQDFDDKFPEGERSGYNAYPFPLPKMEREALKEFLGETIRHEVKKAEERESEFHLEELQTILDMVSTWSKPATIKYLKLRIDNITKVNNRHDNN